MKFPLDAIQFLHNLMHQLLRIENIYRLYFLDLLLFFIFYPVWRINIWTTTSKIYFMTLVIYHFNWIKKKLLPFIDVSKFSLYLERSDLKSLWRISFASLWGVNFILTLLEGITRASSISFEEIIAIVNWIFHASEFWKLIIIFLK